MSVDLGTAGAVTAAEIAGGGPGAVYGAGAAGFIGVLLAVLCVVAVLVLVDVLFRGDDR